MENGIIKPNIIKFCGSGYVPQRLPTLHRYVKEKGEQGQDEDTDD